MCVIETSPVIETRRLLLRAPQSQDVSRIARMANDIDIARMTLRMPHPFTSGHAEDFVLHVASQDPSRANTFVIDWIGREYWGRGYATEALEGALVWASRQWKRRAMVAGHFADNPASGRVLEKAGFLYTGETRRTFSQSRNSLTDTRRMVWLA